METTHIISNRLPVKIKKSTEGFHFEATTGGLATGLKEFYNNKNAVWTGWPGSKFPDKQTESEVTNILMKKNINPVFLKSQDVELYYRGFSNSVIWPLFHYFCQYAEYREEYWEAYKAVNKKFFDAVVAHANEDDIFWVHDYHLLLLPAMLRQRFPNAKIGIFSHIPFPPYEIFRNLPWGKQILKGLLGADLIGFHTRDYVYHFKNSLTQQTSARISGNNIKYKDREIGLRAFPMGIDYEKFETTAKSREVQQIASKCKSNLGDGKIVLSVDRLDYSKGIIQRLKAFDCFLEQNKDWRGKTSMLLIAVPSRTGVDHYKQLKEELDECVGRINGKYAKPGWVPVQYHYRSMNLEELCALYSLADVALVTPFRDGMNLISKEFLACKTDSKGVLILSEMAGSAKELKHTLLINPNDINQMASALLRALQMPEEKQVAMNRKMQNHLRANDIQYWSDGFISQLKDMAAKNLEHKKKDAHNHHPFVRRYTTYYAQKRDGNSIVT